MIALTVYVNMPQFLLQFGLGSLWVVGVIPGQWAGVMLDKHTQAHPVRGILSALCKLVLIPTDLTRVFPASESLI